MIRIDFSENKKIKAKNKIIKQRSRIFSIKISLKLSDLLIIFVNMNILDISPILKGINKFKKLPI